MFGIESEAEPKADLVLRERYRLIKPLNSGGMGNLWIAHDISLDVDVAVKFMRVPSEGGAGRNQREASDRLVHEARVIAQLKHPAIVNVTEVAQMEWGQPFIVMELLKGEDLGAVLARKGPLGAEEALRYLLPIAQGLSVAHDKGIVHRDLKPANIFLAERGDGATQPKLLDFGVAKSDRKQKNFVTQVGEMLGSPAYMSPEQVQGDTIDTRSDVWSFCMTLYELLSGKLPFDRPTQMAITVAIMADEIEPLDQVAKLDSELAAIVARGLNKDPARRWPDVRELGRALAGWLSKRGVTQDASGGALTFWTGADAAAPAHPIHRSRSESPNRNALWLAVAVCGFSAITALVAFWIIQSEPPASSIVAVDTASDIDAGSAEADAAKPTLPVADETVPSSGAADAGSAQPAALTTAEPAVKPRKRRGDDIVAPDTTEAPSEPAPPAPPSPPPETPPPSDTPGP